MNPNNNPTKLRETAMEIIEAVKKRKSIRDFTSDPVPQTVLREILEISCRTPSAMNTQPFEFTVIAGDILESVRLEIIARQRDGEKPHVEHSVSGWPIKSVYRDRQVQYLVDLVSDEGEKVRLKSSGVWL